MKVPIKLLGFAFLVLSFTFVQAQEKEVFCTTPSLKNGFTERASINEKEMFYSCNTGYKPFSGNWWESVTCKERSWSDEPQCIRKEECGAYPKVNHGKIKQTKNHDRESAEFECDPGFKSTNSLIKCVKGTWETPTCEEDVRCDIPPEVENAVIPSKPQEYYPEGSSVTYKCRNLFTIRGPSRVFCHSATWGETPKCEGEICPPPPHLEHGDYTVVRKNGEVITEVYYTCQRDYVLDKQQQYYKCQNGRWETPPKCLEPCEITSDIIEKYSVQPPQYKVYVKHGDTYWLYCKSGWNIGDRWRSEYLEVSCSNGEFKSDKTCNKKNRLKRRFGVETLRSEDPSDVSRA